MPSSTRTKKRVTHRNGRKPRVIDVRSRGAVKAFENLIVQGPLTLVYVNAKWCGACHRFNKEVWSPLTKLKNKGLNLASVDSEYIGKTSLANVPRKFFPTLMLVGRDKKPAEFKDENGEPTNAMPRKESLAEDRATLSALVQAPMNHPLANIDINNQKLDKENIIPIDTEILTTTTTTTNNPVDVEVERTITNMPLNMSAKRNTLNAMPASPFESLDSTEEVPSMVNASTSINSTDNTNTNKTFKIRPRSSAPDVASDLLASQNGSPSGTAAVLIRDNAIRPMRGGGNTGLLFAITEKVKSLDAILGMRKDRKTRKSKS
jgi:thiol-disulfide isomerase/thioredoxin